MTRWFHGSRATIAPGQLLVPSASRGAIHGLAERVRAQIAPEFAETVLRGILESHRADRVYISPRLESARRYASPGGTLYEVEPIGELRVDPQEALGCGFSCESARVLAVIESDVPALIRDILVRATQGEHFAGLITPSYFSDAARDLFWSLVRRVPPREGIHGVKHWERVLENAFRIALEIPADPFVLAAFAALHDARRESDGPDPEHGERAATLARELADADRLDLFDPQLDLLCEALAEHDRGQVTDNPTIGACWDADRLDLPRVGIDVNPRLLSTAAAVALLDQTHQGATCTTPSRTEASRGDRRSSTDRSDAPSRSSAHSAAPSASNASFSD